jgi:hypothetical protein
LTRLALIAVVVVAGCWSGPTPPAEPSAPPRQSQSMAWPTTEVPPGFGRLRIVCEPPAYIFLDGVDTSQTTPTALVVTAQHHELELYRSIVDKTDVKLVIVEVVSGSDELVNVRFDQ